MKKSFVFIVVAAILIGFNASVFAEDKTTNSHKNKKNNPAIAWHYEDNKDEMSGGITHTATVMSANKINLEFPYHGGTIAWFELSNHPRFGRQIIFTINKGQLPCSIFDGCKVLLRFDDSIPIEYFTQPAADGSSNVLFIRDFDKHIVEKLKVSKQLIIEAMFYRSGNHQFKFNISGLEWQEEVKDSSSQ